MRVFECGKSIKQINHGMEVKIEKITQDDEEAVMVLLKNTFFKVRWIIYQSRETTWNI